MVRKLFVLLLALSLLIFLAWFFLTPIFYPIDVLPSQRMVLGFNLDLHRLMYIVNPMASLIATYRVILYSGAPPAFDFLARTVLTALAVVVVGYLLFKRFSRVFGEEV